MGHARSSLEKQNGTEMHLVKTVLLSFRYGIGSIGNQGGPLRLHPGKEAGSALCPCALEVASKYGNWFWGGKGLSYILGRDWTFEQYWDCQGSQGLLKSE